MTLIVGDVIDAARDRNAAFDRNRHPAKGARRFLSAYVKELSGKIAKIDEAALLIEHVEALPLVSFAAGITLPAHRAVAAVAATRTGDGGVVPVDLIPWGQRNGLNVPTASAWEVGGVLYLGGTVNNWSNIASVAVAYVPIITPFATDADTIPLLDTVELCLVERAALYFARRGHNDKRLAPINLAQFVAVAEDAERAFLDDVANGVGSTHFRVLDVWGGRD